MVSYTHQQFASRASKLRMDLSCELPANFAAFAGAEKSDYGTGDHWKELRQRVSMLTEYQQLHEGDGTAHTFGAVVLDLAAEATKIFEHVPESSQISLPISK